MKTNKAFTLIELLTVVSIIFLLTSIIISNSQEAKAKADDSARIQQARQVAIAMETYKSSNNKTPAANGVGGIQTGNLYAKGSTEFEAAMQALNMNIPDDDNRFSTLAYYDDGINATLITTLESETSQENNEGCYTSDNNFDCTAKEVDGNIIVTLLDSEGNTIHSWTQTPNENPNGGGKYVYGDVNDGGEVATEESCFTLASGKIMSYDEINCPKDVFIPSTIGGKAVTAIDSYVFRNNQLTSVSIPEGVTYIGYDAFSDNQLTSVSIPNSVRNMDSYAFRNNQLESVSISNNISSIRGGVFYNNKLTSVTIPGSARSIDHNAFGKNQLTSVTIHEGVKYIYNSAFYGNQLTSVSIPSSVRRITGAAFRKNQLESVTISDGLTSIETSAFQDNKLTSVTIPGSVTSIGGSAFANNQLTSVTIYGVTSIGSSAFANNQLTSQGSVSINASTTYNTGSFGSSCTVANGCIVVR